MTFETLNAMVEPLITDPDTDPTFLRYAHIWLAMYKNYKENPDEKDTVFFNGPAISLTVSTSPINASLASSNMELMDAIISWL